MKTLHLAGAALAVALAPALALAGPNDAQIAAIVVTANQVDIDAGAYAQAPAGADDVKAFARQMVTGRDGGGGAGAAGDAVGRISLRSTEIARVAWRVKRPALPIHVFVADRR